MNVYTLAALAVFTSCITYDGYATRKQIDALSKRVVELENRITVEDESRREMQRLSFKKMVNDKRRKDMARCQARKLKSL